MKCLAVLIALSFLGTTAAAQEGKRVTVENFVRAESDLAFAKVVKGGGFGKFNHGRELSPLAQQLVAYNAHGYFEPNEQDAYTLNNLTAKKSGDGSVAVQFGGWDGKTPNCLPITPGWNYIVRLYRPRAEILRGTWTFPEAQPLR